MLSRWELPRDIARARVHAVRFGAGHPVFRVGPSDRPPRVEGDATVLVLDGEHPHRRRELDLIVQREGDGEWHGERDIDPAHQWTVTANGILGRFVDITFDASIAFRRTVRTHPVVDIDAAELVRLRVDELPDAATLNFE